MGCKQVFGPLFLYSSKSYGLPGPRAPRHSILSRPLHLARALEELLSYVLTLLPSLGRGRANVKAFACKPSVTQGTLVEARVGVSAPSLSEPSDTKAGQGPGAHEEALRELSVLELPGQESPYEHKRCHKVQELMMRC